MAFLLMNLATLAFMFSVGFAAYGNWRMANAAICVAVVLATWTLALLGLTAV